ncbi:MAG: hypothetical protein N2C14_31665 [Planctomycetales bacterium]
MATREEREAELRDQIHSEEKWNMLEKYREITGQKSSLTETVLDETIIQAILDHEFPPSK